MSLAVVAEITDRFDDRLAALPEGAWASATPWEVTSWREGRPERVDRLDRELPGPLVWLEKPRRLACGPGLLGDGSRQVADLVAAALGDLPDGSARRFVLAVGTVDPDGRQVLLALRRQEPRTLASLAPPIAGPPSRVSVFDADGGRGAVLGEGELPTSVAWGGHLLLGFGGRVEARTARDDAPSVLRLPGPEAALALTASPAPAAGTAAGLLVAWTPSLETRSWWEAHAGRVRAIAWSPGADRLASGGDDGWLRQWTPDGRRLAELDLGGAVAAVAWLDDGRLVVATGSPEGRVLVVDE